jgi:hypothetical protein
MFEVEFNLQKFFASYILRCYENNLDAKFLFENADHKNNTFKNINNHFQGEIDILNNPDFNL